MGVEKDGNLHWFITDDKQENSYSANGFRRKKKAKSGAVTTEYSAGLATAVANYGGRGQMGDLKSNVSFVLTCYRASAFS